MMTVKQVSSLTGVSVRTLQFYDEIDLFKPTESTDAGYRLYDDRALEVLQQILFFKELDFTLKEIKTIMKDPQFDQAAALEKQRELLRLKRDRLDSLLGLLDRLIKGEKTMEFNKFDMTEYFRVLNDFKETHTDEIVKRLGSMDSFEEMTSGLRSRETEIAAAAVKQYGSLEAFTKAMETSFETFLSEGPAVTPSEADRLIHQTEALTKQLTADLSKDPASPEIQDILRELTALTEEHGNGVNLGDHYWSFMAECYESNPAFLRATDGKYGAGASKFMALALKAYVDGQ